MEDSLYTRDSCHTTEDIRTSHSSQNQSIKVHPFMTSTRREEGARLRWMHADWGMVSSMWMSTHTHTQLEPKDVILSSSHAKKLEFFHT